jgi:hypothetical protein
MTKQNQGKEYRQESPMRGLTGKHPGDQGINMASITSEKWFHEAEDSQTSDRLCGID